METRRPRPGLAGALALASLVACSKADFKSENDKVNLPETATTACEGGEYTAEDLVLHIKDDAKARMLLTGEFCPQAPAELRIVFLVDFSLSMYNAKESRGNDMVVDGSCGRLKAADAIIDKHASNAANQHAEIKVGVIQFASDLVGQIPLTPLADMKDQRTTDNFCRGIDGTNYKAAFEAATAMLKDEPGTKVVYLISDGLPTEGGGGARENAPRHRDAAQKAADAMRAGVKSLTYNTVFLGNVHELDEEGFDPEKFLDDLTGSKDRVKVVDSADKLAEDILELEKPPVALDAATATAVLSADGVDGRDVGFEWFKPAEGKDQIWTFRTKEFDAFPGAARASKLKVSAKDQGSGAAYELLYTIEPKVTAKE